MRERFTNLSDARSVLDGTQDWEFGGNASWEGWCQYAYTHATLEQPIDQTLTEYLISVGEDPGDYL